MKLGRNTVRVSDVGVSVGKGPFKAGVKYSASESPTGPKVLDMTLGAGMFSLIAKAILTPPTLIFGNTAAIAAKAPVLAATAATAGGAGVKGAAQAHSKMRSGGDKPPQSKSKGLKDQPKKPVSHYSKPPDQHNSSILGMLGRSVMLTGLFALQPAKAVLRPWGRSLEKKKKADTRRGKAIIKMSGVK